MHGANSTQTVSNVRTRLNFPIVRGNMILVAMTDETRSGDPVDMIDRLPRGSILIFRHYSHPDRRRLAKSAVQKCRKKGIRCLIAGDVRLARDCRADGLHFPEYQLAKAHRHKFIPAHWIITAATHDMKAVQIAQKRKFDAAILSPVFATKSHPEAATLGVFRLTEICRQIKFPIIALGGITPCRINRLRMAGAVGAAGIGLFSGK